MFLKKQQGIIVLGAFKVHLTPEKKSAISPVQLIGLILWNDSEVVEKC